MWWDALLRPVYRWASQLPPELYANGAGGAAGQRAERELDELLPLPPPAWDGPLHIPYGRAEAVRVYGNPGPVRLDRRWERANMVLARNLPGAPRGSLYCHRLAEPFVREALRRAALLAPGHAIERLGCFAYRRQRHDSSRPLSYHAFGVALDINPADNRAWRRGQHGAGVRVGDMGEPFSAKWRRTWPDGLPERFVQAFESCGWCWGGRWHHFVDPMHFELVKSR